MLSIDDLKRFALAEVQPLKKTMNSIAAPQLRPAEQYRSHSGVVSTSILVLTKDVPTNKAREDGKLHALTRKESSGLPQEVRRGLVLGTLQKTGEGLVEVKTTDRTGYGFTVLKRWTTDKAGNHLDFSQPSNALQHADDLVAIVESVLRPIRELSAASARPPKYDELTGVQRILCFRGDPRQ